MVSMQAGITDPTSTIFRAGKAILHVHIKPFCVMLSRSMIRTQGSIATLPDCVIGHTVRDPDKFKQDFFATMDYYLQMIHDKYPSVAFSLSGGVDSNTLAAEYTRLFPGNSAQYVTSQIDDVTDESTMALNMQAAVANPIECIPIRFGQRDILSSLEQYLATHVPPRFSNLLSEYMYIDQLKETVGDSVNVSGMEADGLFGGFGGEYMYFAAECLAKHEWSRAKAAFTANMISFAGVTDRHKIDKAFYHWALRKTVKSMLQPVLRRVRKTPVPYYSEQAFLKVTLPERESHKVKTHRQALAYQAFGDGALHDTNVLYEAVGLHCVYPYGGYRFQELSAHCDPLIFSYGVNKSCLRQAIRGLVPDVIIDNVVKRGQPGVTLKTIMQANHNTEKVIAYLQQHEKNTLVRTEILSTHFTTGNFDNKDFCALALIVFEDMLKQRYQKNVTV